MKSFNDEELLDEFLAHVKYFKIAHHVMGRIRVKALLSKVKKLSGIDKMDFEGIITRIPGIKDYRVNMKAFTVVIEYDPKILPYDLWQDVGELHKHPLRAESLKERLLGILESK